MLADKKTKFLYESGINLKVDDILESRQREEYRSSALSYHFRQVYEKQIVVEEKILSSERWCTPPLNHTPTAVNYDEINKLLLNGKNILGGEALEKLACVINNIVMLDSPSNRSNNSLLKNFITNLRVIGADSAYGLATIADMKDRVKNAFVLKSPQKITENSNISMRHEVVIGKITNSLRAYIPNYSYMLGYFECSPPIISDNTKKNPNVASWCSGEKTTTYAIYENVKGELLGEYVRNCSQQDFIDVLIQILYALRSGYEKFGFTHYDLHTSNIIMRDIETEGIYIGYDGDYVYASKIATFIDYGMGHAYYKDERGNKISLGFKSNSGKEGAGNLMGYGVYLDQPNPITDAFKILYHMLENTKYSNPKVYDTFKDLILFFSRDSSIKDFFDNNIDYIPTYGTKILSEVAGKFDYTNFIRFCRQYALYKALDDPAVKAEKVKNEEIYVGNLASKPLFTTDIKNVKVTSLEEVYDLIEPLMIKADDLRRRSEKTSTAATKVKLENSLEITTKIYNDIISNIDKKDLNKYRQTFINQIKKSSKEVSLPFNYIKVPTVDFMALTEPGVYSLLISNLLKVSNFIDKIDMIERNSDILHYIDLIFGFDDANIEDASYESIKLYIKTLIREDISLLTKMKKYYRSQDFPARFILDSYENFY